MPYWANTSSNDIVKSLVERADISVKGELEHLIDGGRLKNLYMKILLMTVYTVQMIIYGLFVLYRISEAGGQTAAG